MSDATYAGAVIMEVNGQEVEIISVKPTTTTGRKVVKTMNRRGRARGYSEGVTEFKLSVTAAIPVDGTKVDWDNITNAKITIYPISKESARVSYIGCFSSECSEQYEAENEARIDIEMFALDKVIE
ncbi:phage tail protein [Neisseriaceae bacterium ESL0693]|nr:phage tail protein [Neisseriaceae bacterium ESL0693]